MAQQGESEVQGENEFNKLRAALRSRKIWIGTLLFTVLTALLALDRISAELYVTLLTIDAGILTGSVALEDGLRALLQGVATGMTQDANHDQPTINPTVERSATVGGTADGPARD